MFGDHNAMYPGLSRVTINGVSYAILETFGDHVGSHEVPMTDGNVFYTFRGRVGSRMHTEDDCTYWKCIESKLVEDSGKHRYTFIAEHLPLFDLRDDYL